MFEKADTSPYGVKNISPFKTLLLSSWSGKEEYHNAAINGMQ